MQSNRFLVKQEWRRAVASNGSVYWYHAKTMETTFVRPDGYNSEEDLTDETQYRRDSTFFKQHRASLKLQASGRLLTPKAGGGPVNPRKTMFAVAAGGPENESEDSDEKVPGTKGAAKTVFTLNPVAVAPPAPAEGEFKTSSPVSPPPPPPRPVTTSAADVSAATAAGKRKSLASLVASLMPKSSTGSKTGTLGQVASGRSSVAAAVTTSNSGGTAESASSSSASGVKSLLNKWKSKASEKYASPHLELSPKGALGVPVRDLLQALYKRRRDRTIMEAFVFALWAAFFFSLIFFSVNIQSSNETNLALGDRFIEQDIPSFSWRATFNDISDAQEWWQWVEGPLFQGIFESSNLGGADGESPLRPLAIPTVNGVLRVLGGVSIRQVRVANGTCGGTSTVGDTSCLGPSNITSVLCPQQQLATACFDSYSPATVFTAPFGPPSAPQRYTYSSGCCSDIEGLYGWGPESYGTSGYVVTLPASNATASWLLLKQLREDNFVGPFTRAIVVDANLYNPENSLLSSIRFQYEQLATGYSMVSYRFYTFPVLNRPIYITIVEGFYIAFVLFWLQKAVRGLIWARPFYAYFFRVTNLFDTALIVCNAILIKLWVQFHASSSIDAVNDAAVAAQQAAAGSMATVAPLANFPATAWIASTGNGAAVDFFDQGRKHSDMLALAGFTGLVGALRSFKFLSLNKKISILWSTLSKALPLLLAYAAGLMLLVAAYAFVSMMLFGSQLAAFHSFGSSVSTLLRMALGDVDYAALSRAAPIFAPLFYASQTFLIFLVSLNLVIAIINAAFVEVNEELKRADRWQASVVTLDSFVIQRLTLFARSNCDPVKRCCRTFNRKLPQNCCKSTYGCCKGTQQIFRTVVKWGGGKKPVATVSTERRRSKAPGMMAPSASSPSAGSGVQLVALATTGTASGPPSSDFPSPTPLLSTSSETKESSEGAETGLPLGSSRTLSMRKKSEGDAAELLEGAAGPATTSNPMMVAATRSASASAVSSPAGPLSAMVSGPGIAPGGAGLERGSQAWADSQRRKSVAKIAVVVGLPVDEAEIKAAEEARRARHLQADERQIECWRREALFMKALNKLYHLAKRGKGLDLYVYLEGMVAQPAWDCAYLGVHELCVLSNPLPCPPGQHLNCAARKLVDAFQNLKRVTMFGGVSGAYRHVPSASFINRQGYRLYAVEKTNSSGYRQRRLMCIDPANAMLVNNDMRMRVRKKLPLTQLLQVEQYEFDPLRLTLVFSSASYIESSAAGGSKSGVHSGLPSGFLETTYNLHFDSEDNKQFFFNELSEAMERVATLATGGAGAAGGDLGPSVSDFATGTSSHSLGGESMSGPGFIPAIDPHAGITGLRFATNRLRGSLNPISPHDSSAGTGNSVGGSNAAAVASLLGAGGYSSFSAGGGGSSASATGVNLGSVIAKARAKRSSMAVSEIGGGGGRASTATFSPVGSSATNDATLNAVLAMLQQQNDAIQEMRAALLRRRDSEVSIGSALTASSTSTSKAPSPAPPLPSRY